MLLLLAGCEPAPGDTGKPASQASALAAAQAEGRARTIDRSRAGSPAPTVAFVAQGGAPATIAGFGKPVLVNLWATWCAPCIVEMPDLDALAAARPGLAVVPVSVDLGGWPAVDGFFAPGKFKALTPYLDQRGGLQKALGATGLPVSILYDVQGRELWRVSGPLPWTTPEIGALLDEAINPAAAR